MGSENKRRFFLDHRKSSAFFVSVAIHVIFLAVALTFVAVKVVIKPEQSFEAKEIKRPNMKLRKLQVPVKQSKKSQAPKLRKTIVAKPKTPTVDIQLPEVVGVKGGTGFGSGTGLGGLGFNFDADLFGSSNRGSGNEFIGSFYDLKQTLTGEPTKIGKLAADNTFNAEAQTLCMEVINRFVRSGFKESEMKGFFKAPKEKFTTSFCMPPMGAAQAPKAFGVDDQVEPSYWLCVYRGQITAPKTGKYRFWGLADDVLIVRVNRRIVLDGCWPEHIGRMTDWTSRDDDSRRYQINKDAYGSISGAKWMDMFPKISQGINNGQGFSGILRSLNGEDGQTLSRAGNYMCAANRLVIGDWINLKEGQRVDVEVAIGEIPGGFFNCRLLIEQQGAEYQMVESDAGPRPVLPIFKTTDIDEKLISQMDINPNEMTVSGPDFGVVAKEKSGLPF